MDKNRLEYPSAKQRDLEVKKIVLLILVFQTVFTLLLISCSQSTIEDDGRGPEEDSEVQAVNGNRPPAIETIQYGQSYGQVQLLSSSYKLEVIVPPAKTTTAPFDSDVLPDGRILMRGNSGRLVSVSLEGEIAETEYPGFGSNFESDDYGTMWYYDFPSGMLSYWKVGMEEAEQVASLPPVYSDGSVAVSPDGLAVYVGWWQSDSDIDLQRSVVYRYSEEMGLERVVEGTAFSPILSAVEITPNGNVFIAYQDGIYELTETNQLKIVLPLSGTVVPSDGMTSDDAGNVYFSAYGLSPGLYKLTPEGTLETVITMETEKEVPYGLSWDNEHQMILGVRKELGEIVAIDMDGNMTILNNPSGLITPIPVKEHPNGTIYVNGDEAGLLKIDGSGIVHSINVTNIDCFVSYQPPAADFCFVSGGIIYYSFAAPGFESMIVTIDKEGRAATVTEDVGKPAGIDVGADGVVYYADYQKSGVYAITEQGTSICIADNIPHPVGLVVDSEANFWVGASAEDIVCDPLSVDNECLNTRILRFREGEPAEQVFAFDEEWSGISFFDVDANGNLYIPLGNVLLLRTPDGGITEIAIGFNTIRGVLVAIDGCIYITDYGVGALYRLVPVTE